MHEFLERNFPTQKGKIVPNNGETPLWLYDGPVQSFFRLKKGLPPLLNAKSSGIQ
jgi:hypothetical protein